MFLAAGGCRSDRPAKKADSNGKTDYQRPSTSGEVPMDRLQAATRLLLPLAALALAAPAGARTIEGWEVRPGADSCSMSSVFADDVTLALIWSPKDASLGFLAAGKDWDRLRALEGERVALELRFDGDAELTEWQDEGARIVAGRGGGKDGVIGYWGSERSSDLAAAVTGADSVSIRVDEMDLGDYELGGTGAAYRELMRCGRNLVPAG